MSALFVMEVQVHVQVPGKPPSDPEVMAYKTFQILKLHTAHKMHKVESRESLIYARPLHNTCTADVLGMHATHSHMTKVMQLW